MVGQFSYSTAPVISDDEYGLEVVEGDMGELGLLLGHDRLIAQRLVLVDVQVEHVHLQCMQ